MQNPQARRIMGSVLIVTVAVLAWLLWNPRATKTSPESDADHPRTRRTVQTTDIPWENPTGNPPERRKESLAPMQKSRLDSFFIPAVSGNKVTVTEAIQRLEKAFDDACRESGEERPPLTLEVRDDPGARLTFSFAGSTFGSDLRHLATLAGMEVMQKGNPRNAFVLVPARSEAAPAEVRIEDPVRFARGFRELGGMVARHEFTPPSIRPSSEPEEPPPTVAEWREILRQSGLCQDPGYACRQDEHGGLQITVTASAADLRRITSAKVLVAESRAQLKVTTRLLASEQSLQAPGEVLDQQQTRRFMREMAQKKGTDLMTLPSIAALQNQLVDLQIIKEREIDGRADWTGVKFSLVARFVGWKIAGNPRMEIRSDAQVGFSAEGRKNVLLKSGETAVVPLASPEKALVMCLVTFERIDATGRDLNGPREPETESVPTLPPLADTGPDPVAKAVPGSHGMVFSPYSNKIVDVTDIPSGTLVADPEFPPEEKRYFRVP